MSFAELLRVPAAAAALNVARRNNKTLHKYEKHSVEADIDLGERVASFLQSLYGQDRADVMFEKIAQRHSGSQPSPEEEPQLINVDDEEDVAAAGVDRGSHLPYGFWRQFITDELRQQYTDRKRMRLSRALQFYVQRKKAGACSRTAMRGLRAKDSCRRNGGSQNARKASGLAFQLLQYFVDYVQRLLSRADSMMMLTKAREFRNVLLSEKYPEDELPKLDGNNGAQWFKRWREMYGIVRKITGMKLKVPWKKIKRRVRVFLGNVFRLRAFWAICHPGTKMRWLSLDQKPSWFNNAGHMGALCQQGGSAPTVREDYAQSLQRYSILTSVQSWGNSDPDDPPKVAILFKAAPNGHVIKRLRESTILKPWVKVQVQDNGSYRSSDMVEALDWMLPVASNSKESIVLVLDWYAGHLTEEVAEVVRSKGHVLMFHGGGCTPFTQVNDTHLHSKLARLLLQLDNDWALKERDRLLSEGKNKTPKKTREDIVSLVQTAWLTIDHAHVAAKGYDQTGPTMPLEGTVYTDDVYGDLLKVMRELELSSTPTEVGMTMRDEAVAYVREGFDSGKWTTWADYHKLIEEHDALEDALVEGLEAFGEEACHTDDEGDDDDDGDDNDDGDDDAGGADGDGPGLPAKTDSVDEPSAEASHGDETEFGADAGGPGSGSGSGGVVHLPGSEAVGCSSVDVAAARRLLYEDAIRRKDDTMLRCLRKQMHGETQKQKDASSEVSVILGKRLAASQLEETKRRREANLEERLAAKDLEGQKLHRAKVEQATAEARLNHMRQTITNRRELVANRRADVLRKAQARWLQTQYPVKLAKICIDLMLRISPRTMTGWVADVEGLVNQRIFDRILCIRDLWVEDKTLTSDFGTIAPFGGGSRRHVRCGMPFRELLAGVVPPTTLAEPDAADILLKLFSKCVPCARRIFTGIRGPLRLLHVNDYILEKSFVYGIVSVSKWLGREHFGHGVHGRWPPAFPADLVPSSHRPAAIEVGVSTVALSPETAAASSGHT